MTFTEMIRGWVRDMPAWALWILVVFLVIHVIIGTINGIIFLYG